MAYAKHSDFVAENQVTRRNLLRAAPAAGLAAMLAGAAPVGAEPETPVSVLFREWQRLGDTAEDRSLSDDECDALCTERHAVEARISETPAETAMDVLRKVCAASDYGAFSIGDGAMAACWDEARRLIG